MAYHQQEPWDEERADLRMGVLASLIVNMFRKKGKKPYEPADFVLKFGTKKKQDWRSILKQVEVMNAMMGGKDKRGL